MKVTRVIYFLLILATSIRLINYYKSDITSVEDKTGVSGKQGFIKYKKEGNTLSDKILSIPLINSIRKNSTQAVHKIMPSPHSALLLGMTIGMDELDDTPVFKDMLKTTGTIHVVVVSGYNINLVFDSLIKILGSRYRFRNMVLGLLGTLAFSILSGFEPPVIRAWIMGALLSLSKYYGRSVNVLNVLLFAALVICIASPAYFFNLSFQLSFLATLSLVLFSEIVSGFVGKFVNPKKLFVEDFCTSISAQMLLWPFMSYKFGQVSLISPIVNAFILWTIPITTVIGGLYLILGSMVPSVFSILGKLAYFPLEYFVRVIEICSTVKFAVLNVTFSKFALVIYYAGLVLLLRRKRGEL